MNAWFLGMFHRCSASVRVTTMIRIHQSAHFATPNRKRPLSLCKLASGYHLDLNLTTVVHSCCLLCATLWVWLLHFAHPANHVGHCLRIHPNTGFLQIFLQTILGHQGRPSFFGGCFLGGQVCEPEDVTLGPFTFEFLNNRGCLFIISDKQSLKQPQRTLKQT